MKIEITITMEIDEEEGEVPEEIQTLMTKMLEERAETDEDAEEEETKSFEQLLDELPSDKHRYVFRALVQNQGRSRRIIHKEAAKMEDSPFNDFDPDDATSERGEVGETLWELQRLDYTYHEGNRWYPKTEKFHNSALDTDW